jgi:hypothetical protein
MQRYQMTVLASAILASTTLAAAEQPTTVRGAEVIGGAVEPVFIHIDANDLRQVKDWQPGDPIKDIPLAYPKGFEAPARDPRPNDLDPHLQNPAFGGGQSGGMDFDTPIVSVDGIDFTGSNPSDTVGDVGNEYYIQLVNGGGGAGSSVVILNKDDGSTAMSFALESLAAGSGTGCTSGSGDPVINFDETVSNGPTADPGRWVLTEFTGNSLCFYISQTADPTTGDWYLYEFGSVSGGLPDYPKYAVWNDAYYVGTNENQPMTRVYAIDRNNMINGDTARALQSFLAPGLPGFGFQHLMPVDWDGDMEPPANAPGLFMRHRDDEIHDAGSSSPTQDIIELWEFTIDFDDSNNTSFTGPINVPISEFDSEFCNLVFSGCLAQPNSGTTLFALLQPIMWRAQYRNFGSHQSIVASLTTDINGNDIAGVRWFELRNTGAGWTTFQDGTVSDGSDVSRWMSSAAMDESGNIVAAYNVVGDTTPAVFPGMRYSGRLAGDPLGTMPRGEVTIMDGSAPNNSIRYGDYSALTVDPLDGCTFWYTAQYNETTSWNTRVASFRFDDCGEPGFNIGGNVREASVCTLPGAANYQYDLDIVQVSGFTDPVTLSINPALPTGITGSFSNNPVNPPGMTSLSGQVATSVAAGNYLINIDGTAMGANDRNIGLSLDVFTQLPGEAALVAPANAADLQPVNPVLEWTNGAQLQALVLEVATDAGFSSIVYTANINDGSETHTVAMDLNSSTTYYWRLRSSNQCGEASTPEVRSFTTVPAPGDCPVGAPVNLSFMDDIEGGINGWTHSGTGDTWEQSTARAFSGTTSWHAENPAAISDQSLVTPVLSLPSGELPLSLTYWNHQTMESATGGACWDAGILEISTDGGSSWTQLNNELLTDPYDGTVNTFATAPNPLAGLEAWCGDPEDWTRSVVDLAAYQGQDVQFRFRLGSDGTIGREGWYIDDVQIQSCGAVMTEVILSDGFEAAMPIR